MNNRIPSILLIGPTGSGKSPLGDYLQVHGLAGRRCHHFDFGAHLRAVAAESCPGFNKAEVAFVRNVLSGGTLLKNEAFPMARKILLAFLKKRRVKPGDILILNGLPRHRGQARAMAGLVAVQAVVRLVCAPRTIQERLRRDTGGDRANRTDDNLPLVRRKLAIFARHTVPLLDYYREAGAEILALPVGVETRAADMARFLRRSLPFAKTPAAKSKSSRVKGAQEPETKSSTSVPRRKGAPS